MVVGALRSAVGSMYDTASAVQQWALPRLRFASAELDVSYRTEVPLRRRLRWYRRGFLTSSAVLYDFDRYRPDQYLNYFQDKRQSRACDLQLSRQKYVFDRVLRWNYPDVLPDVYALVRGSSAYAPDGTVLGDVWSWVDDRVSDGDRIVFKPDYGYSGKGVFVLERRDGVLRANGTETDEDDLRSRTAGPVPYLAVEHVEQAAYSARIYPHSTNTIRLITLWDPEADASFVADAIHRVGTDESKPVDNGSTGGIAVGIDLESGELQRGVRKPRSATPTWYERHPDTGAQIQGVEIPRWNEVRSRVCEAADELYYMPLAAWDLALTDDGFRVIECNTTTALGMIQAHGPLCADERTRRVLSHHGVL